MGVLSSSEDTFSCCRFLSVLSVSIVYCGFVLAFVPYNWSNSSLWVKCLVSEPDGESITSFHFIFKALYLYMHCWYVTLQLRVSKSFSDTWFHNTTWFLLLLNKLSIWCLVSINSFSSFSFQALKFRLEVSSSDLVFDTDVPVCPGWLWKWSSGRWPCLNSIHRFQWPCLNTIDRFYSYSWFICFRMWHLLMN